MRAVAYLRVSTAEQSANGAGIEAQREAVTAAVKARGWSLVGEYTDAVSGNTAWALRPGLSAAVASVEAREADALVAAKVDRLSRSVVDFASVVERSRRKGWALLALDLQVDTTTPSGELLANVLASFAQFERRMIGVRTAEAMAEIRKAGKHMGRRSTLPETVRKRVLREHRKGKSLAAIARGLNTDEVPTGQGGRAWTHGSVKAVLESIARTA